MQVELVQLESDDVVGAIAKDIADNSVIRLVIGASSRNFFQRYTLYLLYFLIYVYKLTRVMEKNNIFIIYLLYIAIWGESATQFFFTYSFERIDHRMFAITIFLRACP